jgi:hypothetical protein
VDISAEWKNHLRLILLIFKDSMGRELFMWEGADDFYQPFFQGEQ